MENDSPINTPPENPVAIEIAERMAARKSACAGAFTAFALFSLVWMVGYAWLADDPGDSNSIADHRNEKLPSSQPVGNSHDRAPDSATQSPATPTVPLAAASWKGRSFFTHATSRKYVMDDSRLHAEEDSPELELSFEPGPTPEQVVPDPKPVEFAPVSSELPAPQIPVSADQGNSEEVIEEAGKPGAAEDTPVEFELTDESLVGATQDPEDDEPLETKEPRLNSVKEIEPEPTVFSVFLANKPTARPEILFLSHFGQGHWYELRLESIAPVCADQRPSESIGRLASDDSSALFQPANWTLDIVSDYVIGPKLSEIFGEVRGRWARTVSSANPQEAAFSNRELALRWVDELEFGQVELQSFSPDAA